MSGHFKGLPTQLQSSRACETLAYVEYSTTYLILIHVFYARSPTLAHKYIIMDTHLNDDSEVSEELDPTQLNSETVEQGADHHVQCPCL